MLLWFALQASGRAQETGDKLSEQTQSTAEEAKNTLGDRAQQVGQVTR